MNEFHLSYMRKILGAIAIAAIGLVGLSGVASGEELKVTLTGDSEVPPVKTTATGTGTISVAPDMTVTGKITTTGLKGTMAHIHKGAMGKNGPPIIPLDKSGDNEWVVPTNSKLSDADYKAFKAGDLYVNVHSAEHKAGEIRAQLKP